MSFNCKYVIMIFKKAFYIFFRKKSGDIYCFLGCFDGILLSLLVCAILQAEFE